MLDRTVGKGWVGPQANKQPKCGVATKQRPGWVIEAGNRRRRGG